MLDGMLDSIQRSRIENLHSREVDRQSPTGLIFHLYSPNMVDDSPTNYLQDIIDHIQDASHQHPNLPVQSHPWLHTDKNITIFQQTATDYTSNVSYNVGKIFQSQLAFSVELTAI